MNNNPADIARNPESLKKAVNIVNACRDAKGKEVTALDVSDVFDLSEYFVIVSGRSDRHVQGICNKIMAVLKENGLPNPLAIEGFDDGHWVLLDYDDVIVHIFYEPIRSHYDIEGLWMKARRLNIDTASKAGDRKQIAA